MDSADDSEQRAQANLVALLRATGAARERGARLLYERYARAFKARFQHRYRLFRELSEDLVQETLLRAITRIDSYRGGHFEAWLWRNSETARKVRRASTSPRAESGCASILNRVWNLPLNSPPDRPGNRHDPKVG